MASAVFFLDLKGKVGAPTVSGLETDAAERPYLPEITEEIFLCQQLRNFQSYCQKPKKNPQRFLLVSPMKA